MTGGASPRRERRDGVPVVAWEDRAGCSRVALDRCPHRRAPLSAGTVEDGVLRCPYHGWAFDGSGTCVEIPALGPDARVPARARLAMVDEADPTTLVDDLAEETGPWLDGDTPGLEHFWHPLARIGELVVGETTTVELLGSAWQVTPVGEGPPVVTGPDGEPPAEVRFHLDHVWIAPRPPRTPLPEVAEWGDPDWHHLRLTRAEGRYGVGLLLDNQLDAGHFAFVHRATFGRPETALLPRPEVHARDAVVTSVLRVPIAARNDPSAGGGNPVEQHRTMTYEFHAPLWLSLRLDYEELGGSTLILFAFVPLGAGRARVDVDLLFQHPDGFTPEQLAERLAFEETVVGEDLALQRQYDDLRLPLDPTVELHTRADRYSVVCRDLIRSLLDEVSSSG